METEIALVPNWSWYRKRPGQNRGRPPNPITVTFRVRFRVKNRVRVRFRVMVGNSKTKNSLTSHANG